jgi:hypothetical protein
MANKPPWRMLATCAGAAALAAIGMIVVLAIPQIRTFLALNAGEPPTWLWVLACAAAALAFGAATLDDNEA